MKQVILSLSICGLLSFSVASFAQDDLSSLRTSKQIVTWSEADIPCYSIQILAAKTPPTDASFVKQADVIYEYSSNDGFVRYFYGKYDSYAEANKNLQTVRNMGFDGAFISNLRGGGMSVSSSKSSSAIETIGHKQIQIDPDKMYVVQVGAYRYPLYTSYFENVGDIYEYRLNDKIFRYTTTPVKGSEIESVLNKCKASGYGAAFIVEFDLYAPYLIE